MKFKYWNKAKKSFMLIDGIITLSALTVCLTSEVRYIFLFSGIVFLTACALMAGFLIFNTTYWVWVRTRGKNHVPMWTCIRLTLISCILSALSLWLFYMVIAPLTSKYMIALSGCFTAAFYFIYKKRFLRRNNNERIIYFVFYVILPCVLCGLMGLFEFIFIRSGEIVLTFIGTGIIIMDYAPIAAAELSRISIKRVL